MSYTLDKTRCSFQRSGPSDVAHVYLEGHRLCDSAPLGQGRPVQAGDAGEHCRKCIYLLNDAKHAPRPCATGRAAEEEPT